MKKREIALGCMRISKLSVDEAEILIKTCIDSGVKFFDHADIYGRRKCEEIFGEVLKRNPNLRSKMIIQSKCGIRKGFYDFSFDYIINQVKESIRLLNCGYLDILLLHRPDALVDFDELNKAFNYLYDAGLVKSFGGSNMSSWQIELYNSKLEHKIEYNQVQFSIVHANMIDSGLFVNMNASEASDRSGGMLEYAMLKGIKIQAWSPLMASWSYGTFIDNPKYDKLNEKLEELVLKYNAPKNAIAVSWILRHPANIMPIVGTTSAVHLLEMIKGLDITLTKEEWYSLYLSAGHILP